MVLSDNAPPVISAAGAIMDYNTVQRDVLYLHDPNMATVSLQIQALAYNTKKIKPADLPKSWEEVANPKYKGMVALDDPMRAGPLSSMLVRVEDAMERRRSLQQFRQRLESAQRAGAQEHQCDVSLGDLRRIRDLHAGVVARRHGRNGQGHAGGYVKTVPPVVFPRQAGIYAKAPNPNAAKLFAEWLISDEGQKTIDSVGRESSRNDFKSQTSIEVGLRQSHEAAAGNRPAVSGRSQHLAE